MKPQVIDRHTGRKLSDAQILDEVNRDRSSEWQDYTLQDLETAPQEVLYWIDEQYYQVEG